MDRAVRRMLGLLVLGALGIACELVPGSGLPDVHATTAPREMSAGREVLLQRDEELTSSQARISRPAAPEAAAHGRVLFQGSKPTAALDAELHLVAAAAHALKQRDFPRARALLRIHRTRFALGQLGQERLGLEVLMQCLAGSRAASRRAQAYLRSVPGALLSARVRTACGVE